MKREEGREKMGGGRSIEPPPSPQFWEDRTANHWEDNQMETQAIEQTVNLQRVELILPCKNNLLP
jgi:hypothetical protein